MITFKSFLKYFESQHCKTDFIVTWRTDPERAIYNHRLEKTPEALKMKKAVSNDKI